MPSPRRSWAFFAGALVLYGLSAARGPMWGDPSKLTVYAFAGYVPSLNPGDHPGWTVLAWLWVRLTVGVDPVLSLHLLSAVAGAAVVALLHRLVGEATGEARPADGAAAVALVALPLWWVSAVAESYAPALALGLAGCLVSRRRSRALGVVAGAMAGLGAAAHLFSLVVSGPWLAAQRGRRGAVLLGGVLGLAPVWLGVLGVPVDPLTGHRAGGGGSFGWHLATFLRPAAMLTGAAGLVAVVALALGPAGLRGVWWRRGASPHPSPRLACAVLGLFAIGLTGYVPYRLPWMAGFLVVGVLLVRPPDLGRLARWLHLATQAGLLVLLPWALARLGREDLHLRRLPERSNAWYFLCPVKSFESGPQRYARALLAAAPPDAVVLADFNPGAVLRLVQQEARLRPDVQVVPTAVDDALGTGDPVAALQDRIAEADKHGRPVVLADIWEAYYHPTELRRRLGVELTPCGPGWLVRTKN
ncbi:MAG: hypothetical protein MUF10_15520 [Thermoanaerobaculaceae bacterium]|nr:hypothetical protein [Thermoanaerobaculaceae bacterium]